VGVAALMRVPVFLARRLVAGLLTLVALIAITFAVYWALPSTPASIVYPEAQHLTDYQIAHADHLLGLDKPKGEQFADYLWRVAHGDFGKAWQGSQLVPVDHLQQQPLNPVVLPAVRRTLSLILGGALLVVLLAIPLGLLAGTRVGALSDRVIMTVTLIGICTHPYVLGSVLQYVFGYEGLKWVSAGGYCPLSRGQYDQCGGPKDWAMHLALPWTTFALLYLALYTRMIRIAVAETLHEDFVRTARAKGAGELRVLRRHVLPSAGLRVLTMVGMEIGTAIGLCIYIEHAFGLGGIADEAVTAMGGATTDIDLPYTLAIVTLITVIVVVGNLVVDLLYVVVDPRAGWGRSGEGSKSVLGGVF
jgi:peptide/nickel transport system permease protein